MMISKQRRADVSDCHNCDDVREEFADTNLSNGLKAMSQLSLLQYVDEAFRRHRSQCTSKREKDFIDSISCLRQASRHAQLSSQAKSTTTTTSFLSASSKSNKRLIRANNEYDAIQNELIRAEIASIERESSFYDLYNKLMGDDDNSKINLYDICKQKSDSGSESSSSTSKITTTTTTTTPQTTATTTTNLSPDNFATSCCCESCQYLDNKNNIPMQCHDQQHYPAIQMPNTTAMQMQMQTQPSQYINYPIHPYNFNYMDSQQIMDPTFLSMCPLYQHSILQHQQQLLNPRLLNRCHCHHNQILPIVPMTNNYCNQLICTHLNSIQPCNWQQTSQQITESQQQQLPNGVHLSSQNQQIQQHQHEHNTKIDLKIEIEGFK